MSYILAVLAAISVIFGAMTGRLGEVGAAVLTGANQAIEVGIALAGMLCLWGGLTEVMRRSGLMEKLARLLRGPLRRLFPEVSGDAEAMESIAANVSANMLGLGNAATPLSIRAATRLHKLGGHTGEAGDPLCMLMMLNCASIQIIPVTIAGLRAAAGASAPFDVLPAIWVSSALSCATGVIAAKILARRGRRRSPDGKLRVEN
jgi:spore maturation protein A